MISANQHFPVQQYDLPKQTNIIHQYDFFNNADDSVGGVNGTVVNAVPDKDEYERENNAYNLNGTNAYIQSLNSATFNFGLGDFSIYCKFLIKSIGSNQTIIEHGEDLSPTYNEQINIIILSTGQVLIRLLGNTASTYNVFFTGIFLQTNVWYNLILSVYATGMSVFINDKSYSSSYPATKPNLIFTEPQRIGNGVQNGTNINHTKGIISRVIYWNVPLTEYDAKILRYKIAQPRNTLSVTNGLTNLYDLNGNANDRIGGANGTVVNATLTTDSFNIPNSAYLFNGVDTYITTALKTVTQQFGCFIKFISGTIGVQRTILSQNIESGVDSANLILFRISSTGELVLQVVNSTRTIGVSVVIPSITSNTEYNVLLSLDFDDGNYFVLINEDIYQLSTYTLSPNGSPSNIFNIGRDNRGIDYFNNKIEYLAFWNKEISEENAKRILILNKLNEGLIYHYKLSGNTLDSSETLNDITSSPNTTPAIGMYGESDNSYNFSGTGSYMSTPSIPFVGNTGSISLWFNPDVIDFGLLVGQGWEAIGATNPTVYVLLRNNGTIDWRINTGNDYNRNVGTYAANKWQHLVYIWNATSIFGYINGVQLFAETGLTINEVTTSKPVYLGVYGNVFNLNFKGRMSDVRFYNRQISAEEIKNLYKLPPNNYL